MAGSSMNRWALLTLILRHRSRGAAGTFKSWGHDRSFQWHFWISVVVLQLKLAAWYISEIWFVLLEEIPITVAVSRQYCIMPRSMKWGLEWRQRSCIFSFDYRVIFSTLPWYLRRSLDKKARCGERPSQASASRIVRRCRENWNLTE